MTAVLEATTDLDRESCEWICNSHAKRFLQSLRGIQHYERGLMWAETFQSGHMGKSFHVPRLEAP